MSLEEKLGEVNSKVDQVQEVLTKVEKIAEQPTSSFSPSFPPLKSYASVSKKAVVRITAAVILLLTVRITAAVIGDGPVAYRYNYVSSQSTV